MKPSHILVTWPCPFPYSYHKGPQWVCYWKFPTAFTSFPPVVLEKGLIVRLAQAVYYMGPDDSGIQSTWTGDTTTAIQ